MSHQYQNSHSQGVRFSSVNQEIEPDRALQHVDELADPHHDEREEMSLEEQYELRKNLAATLQKSRVQNFSFEPVSLPASRVGHARALCRRTPGETLT